ncbi:UNVERIFIED_CONTAM: hypothetical protein Slati_4293500 [Sesamum latifolium]|uniref:Reverse transcriptase zinc-binding domain-containing protein n=1 Tax=Sesamum latifolium TaxID=2727402 RepID=A0AAW2TD19_9LAMI
MLFSRDDLPSIYILMECLKEFRDVSGLAVNTSKSSIFRAGIENNELHGILTRIDFARGEMPVRYLGIPLAAQRFSISDYSLLMDQIANCISKWVPKSLLFAGWLELIHSVIQGVECFLLQIFPLPAMVVEKIHLVCRNFLWNSRRAPIALEEICHPKEEGGLGIRHIQSWNVALLARILWNIHRKEDTLWVQWVNGVYLKGGEKLKISHLLFANGLMLFSRIEFARGEMLVRYLGIPLAAKRLSITDYSPFVDQIASCISKWTAKCLSFAAAVIEKIHRLCRVFLLNSKKAPLAWEEICHPKEEGELGIWRIQSWNVALLARVLWNIHHKVDTLWIKWVNEVYFRGVLLWDWQPKKSDSPLLRRLADNRDRVVTAFSSSEAAVQHMAKWSNIKGLETSKAYEHFSSKLARQPWKAVIWKAFILPKYSFILWLGPRERLATRDRLAFLQRKQHAHCASTPTNWLNTSSLSANSVILFARISGNGLASTTVCQHFSVRSSGSRKGRQVAKQAAVVGISAFALATTMAKAKKNKHLVEAADRSTKASDQPSFAPILVQATAADPAPVFDKVIATVGQPVTTTAQPSNAPVSIKETAKPADITKVGSLNFHGFISDLEASPFAAKKEASTVLTSNISGPLSEEALPGKAGKIEAAGAKKTPFVGLLG